MKKTIWILNHYVNPGGVGVGERHIKFSNNLIERGYNVRIFSASTLHNEDKNLINNKSKYIIFTSEKTEIVFIRARSYIGNGIKRVLNMFDYAIRIISVTKNFDDERPDVIYASSAHPLTWISGYRLSKRYNSKFIAETRDLWPETLVAMEKISHNSIPAKILYRLEKYVYKKADKLLFTFPGGKDYVENIGIDTSKVRYINNGIDLEDYKSNIKEFIYDDSDLNNNKYKVLFTGSIGKANAIDRIIDAAAILNVKGYTNIEFLIYGDGTEKENLQEYVKSNKMKNVKFKGRVQKKYIPNILSKGDLNLFCLEYLPNLFKYGLSPNKMFDYFASGHPIVSNVECGYDMLEEYNCGFTVKGGSAEALAEGILKFYNMPKEEYDVYCQNALKAAQDFDFKVLTDKLEKVILED